MIATALAVGALCTSAHAQFAVRSNPAKVPGLTSPATSGGFLVGADDCNAVHRNAGTGDVAGVPFTTGTTGTTGQNNAGCLFFGLTGITNDVWFDWTAPGAAANATFSTCGATGVDTKVAIYPLSTCPADNTQLACNDDACGLQSSASWTISANATYTIQLGTFPGATGGSGTFTISTAPIPPCGQKDDGTTENALGLTAGGELGWIKTLNCPLGKHDTVSTAYGTLAFPGSVTNGAASQVVVYTNQSGSLDPNAAGWVVTTKINTVVTNGDTDILNNNTYASTNVPPTKSVMVLASAVTLAGQFPGPMDQNFANPDAWVCGQTGGGALNTTNLAANALPPLNMGGIGFPSTWLLRISDTTTGSGPGTPVCFGDGSGTGCPCGNPGAAGAGCATRFPGDPAGIQCPSTPTNVGTTLTASGSNSLALQGNPATRLVLTANNTTTQPGLFFSGVNTIAGGNGVVFGDGKRCCGGSVKRLQLTDLPGQGAGVNCPATGSTTVDLTNVTAGTVTPGLKLCYQYWYRNPGARSLCGTNFNLSNAITITWTL